MLAKRNLTVWNKEFARSNGMIRLLGGFFREEPFWSNRPLFPHLTLEKEIAFIDYIEPLTDIYDTEKEVKARIEIPGVEKGDIRISAVEGGIEIKVEKREESREDDRKKGRYRIERSYSGFYRYFSLPDSADTEKIEAGYKNGILELRIPKTVKETKKVKEVEIK